MSFLRSLLFSIPLIALSTIVMGTFSVVASFFDRTGNSQHRLARFWGKSLLAASLIRVRPEGVEKLVPSATYVFVSNHASLMDIPALLSELPFQFRFFAKKGLYRIPFLGTHLRRAGHLAVDRSSAILIPLNPRLTVADLAWQVTDSGANRLLHDSVHSSVAREVGERVSGLAITLVTAGSGERGRGHVKDRLVQWFDEAKLELNAVQSIVYTSGTTGRPKGAMITYGNLWWSAIGSALNLGHQDNDRWLACLPLFHVGGMSILFRAVIYGIAVIVHETFDAVAVNRAIDEEKVSIVSVVSTMLQRMLDARGSKTYPPSLRCVLLGGGPASEQLLADCAARNVPVVQTYGLTEAASQVATLGPEDALRKPGSAGKPLFPTEIRIELDGRPARPGEVGEIVVTGPTITPGYLGRPEATATALRGGWLHTGDLGYLDDEGFLYVVDRRDDLVVTGGENVYPAEVERALREHPAVAEAVVVGLPDPQWGQVVAAVIQPWPGTTPTAAEIIAFCRARLAGYKVPQRVRFVDELPRNAAGKILRRSLRDGWPKGSSLS